MLSREGREVFEACQIETRDGEKIRDLPNLMTGSQRTRQNSTYRFAAYKEKPNEGQKTRKLIIFQR